MWGKINKKENIYNLEECRKRSGRGEEMEDEKQNILYFSSSSSSSPPLMRLQFLSSLFVVVYFLSLFLISYFVCFLFPVTNNSMILFCFSFPFPSHFPPSSCFLFFPSIPEGKDGDESSFLCWFVCSVLLVFFCSFRFFSLSSLLFLPFSSCFLLINLCSP